MISIHKKYKIKIWLLTLLYLWLFLWKQFHYYDLFLWDVNNEPYPLPYYRLYMIFGLLKPINFYVVHDLWAFTTNKLICCSNKKPISPSLLIFDDIMLNKHMSSLRENNAKFFFVFFSPLIFPMSFFFNTRKQHCFPNYTL